MTTTSWARILGRSAGWTAVALCGLFGMVAVSEAILQALDLLGAASGAKTRVVPPLFVLHALAGGVALVTGAIQLQLGHPRSRRRTRAHRAVGRSYVAAACITSVSGAAMAAFFHVGVVGQLLFGAWGALWFAATSTALRHARAGRVQEHRRWMIRSFALALVFVMFEPVRTALAAAELTTVVVYPAALATCAVVNLAAAELWLRTGLARRTRDRRTAPVGLAGGATAAAAPTGSGSLLDQRRGQ
jgi:uncharacterized membrane protein